MSIVKNFNIIRELRNMIIFNKDDLLNLRISNEEIKELVKSSEITKLTEDYYTLSLMDIDINYIVLYLLSKKICDKSYITWITALDFLNVTIFKTNNKFYISADFDDEISINHKDIIFVNTLPEIHYSDNDIYLPLSNNITNITHEKIQCLSLEKAILEWLYIDTKNNRWLWEEDKCKFDREYFDSHLIHWKFKNFDIDKFWELMVLVNDEDVTEAANRFLKWLIKKSY